MKHHDGKNFVVFVQISAKRDTKCSSQCRSGTKEDKKGDEFWTIDSNQYASNLQKSVLRYLN